MSQDPSPGLWDNYQSPNCLSSRCRQGHSLLKHSAINCCIPWHANPISGSQGRGWETHGVVGGPTDKNLSLHPGATATQPLSAFGKTLQQQDFYHVKFVGSLSQMKARQKGCIHKTNCKEKLSQLPAEARRASHWETSQYMEEWTKPDCGPQLGLLPKEKLSWGGEG